MCNKQAKPLLIDLYRFCLCEKDNKKKKEKALSMIAYIVDKYIYKAYDFLTFKFISSPRR